MSTDSDAQRHARGRDFTWTEQDDRALAAHASWDRHVREAITQSRPRDQVDEMVDEAAAEMTEAHERAADAVGRRNAFVLEAVALMSLMFVGALVAIVATAVTR